MARSFILDLASLLCDCVRFAPSSFPDVLILLLWNPWSSAGERKEGPALCAVLTGFVVFMDGAFVVGNKACTCQVGFNTVLSATRGSSHTAGTVQGEIHVRYSIVHVSRARGRVRWDGERAVQPCLSRKSRYAWWELGG